MNRFLLLGMSMIVSGAIAGQSIENRIGNAFAEFEKDPQLKHAIASLYVYDATSGKTVFEKNGYVGLAPASTQKVITSVTALELLGSDYRYKSSFYYKGKIEEGTLQGNIMVEGSGDPTLGSWRYASTKEDVVLVAIIDALRKKGVNRINGQLHGYSSNFETQTIPGGWIWDDIGNYYGAGSSGLNWRENQYDLKLKPGSRVGDPCEINGTDPRMKYVNFNHEPITG